MRSGAEEVWREASLQGSCTVQALLCSDRIPLHKWTLSLAVLAIASTHLKAQALRWAQGSSREPARTAGAAAPVVAVATPAGAAPGPGAASQAAATPEPGAAASEVAHTAESEAAAPREAVSEAARTAEPGAGLVASSSSPSRPGSRQ